ncbi:MAG: ribosome silencing factor [Alphaproteobacteria bacterium CG_4_10_14_0_8_um_filter_53_9]|nr:MAG: ribosome silencing factor [Alphaproteobacteria bacterium CG_4_10_14_0_8_um_filter_53_9]
MASGQNLTSEALHDLLLHTLEDYKAVDIVTIPLKGRATFADTLLIASGTSSRHVSSMADALSKVLHAHGLPAKMEGQEGGEWVVVDAVDVVVHLFQPEARLLYNLEKLWSFPAEKELA